MKYRWHTKFHNQLRRMIGCYENICSLKINQSFPLHINNTVWLEKGGKLDFLAFDDGTRTLPINEFTKLSNPVLGESSLETATRQFNPTMATEQSSNFLNQNYSLSYGDRMNFKKSKAIYGYNIVANYRNTHN